MDRDYYVILPNFLADGGEKNEKMGGRSFADVIKSREVGPVDFDATVAYVTQISPINVQVEGRITYNYEDL